MAIRTDHERIVALAKAINRARKDFNARHPGETFKIDDATSRLLELDPDYVPPRPRRPDKAREPLKSPEILTVIKLAERLETSVGKLLGEKRLELTETDFDALRRFVTWARAKLEGRETAAPVTTSHVEEPEDHQRDIPENPVQRSIRESGRDGKP